MKDICTKKSIILKDARFYSEQELWVFSLITYIVMSENDVQATIFVWMYKPKLSELCQNIVVMSCNVNKREK